jgi:hypothetical protein
MLHNDDDSNARGLVTRQNLWAVAIAVLIIAVFTCATAGVQPEFVYTGF